MQCDSATCSSGLTVVLPSVGRHPFYGDPHGLRPCCACRTTLPAEKFARAVEVCKQLVPGKHFKAEQVYKKARWVNGGEKRAFSAVLYINLANLPGPSDPRFLTCFMRL